MKGNLSHEDYLNEPAYLVDWFLAIANQDAELEAEEQRRASKG